MSYDELQSGVVLHYPYLWGREADRGETEGRKQRPTVVAVRLRRAGKADLLALFPITTQEPEADRIAKEIPDTEKRHAGLDHSLRQWIILDEFNAEILPGTYYLEPDARLGRLNDLFFKPLVRDFAKRIDSVKVVKRYD